MHDKPNLKPQFPEKKVLVVYQIKKMKWRIDGEAVKWKINIKENKIEKTSHFPLSSIFPDYFPLFT